jgi:hypothetical protein
MPQPVLDVVAEDPQEQHVPEEVADAPVQKHRRDEIRQPRGNIRQRLLARTVRQRNDAPAPDQRFEMLRRQPHLVDEDGDIRDDQCPVDERRMTRGNGISERKQHGGGSA